jgi:type I restriction enzyme R subunit
LDSSIGLTDARAQQVLCYPYQVSGPRPRYYQEAAINRALIAVLQARRGLRQPRILLNLATGTGKTKVAFQIVWKLKRAREIRHVLFLTDRDYLLGQAMDNEFAPFGDARDRIQGAARTSRDILFATYQAIAADERRVGLYRDYPHDFFDLVMVDECHRARDDSNWRDILTYFTSAVQVGLTATPRRTDNVHTYAYFGDPVSTYALRAGINDGFLAPYRLRRVLLRKSEDNTAPEVTQPGSEDDELVSVAEAVQETSGTLVASTETIA